MSQLWRKKIQIKIEEKEKERKRNPRFDAEEARACGRSLQCDQTFLPLGPGTRDQKDSRAKSAAVRPTTGGMEGGTLEGP